MVRRVFFFFVFLPGLKKDDKIKSPVCQVISSLNAQKSRYCSAQSGPIPYFQNLIKFNSTLRACVCLFSLSLSCPAQRKPSTPWGCDHSPHHTGKRPYEKKEREATEVLRGSGDSEEPGNLRARGAEHTSGPVDSFHSSSSSHGSGQRSAHSPCTPLRVSTAGASLTARAWSA